MLLRVMEVDITHDVIAEEGKLQVEVAADSTMDLARNNPPLPCVVEDSINHNCKAEVDNPADSSSTYLASGTRIVAKVQQLQLQDILQRLCSLTDL